MRSLFCFALASIVVAAAGCSSESGEDVADSEDEALSQCPAAPPNPSEDEAAAPGHVRVWITRQGGDGAEIVEGSDLAFGAPSAATAIDVDDTQRFQTIQGFGAALTDSSAWMLTKKLSCADRQRVMQKLFDRKSGIGLSVLRQPIAASDFTVHGPYSYEDSPGKFSIDHDKAYILPMVKEAMRLNPQLVVVASPWSAPAYMKTNDSMLNGGEHGKLRGDMYGAYAEYLVKFVQAYEGEGVHIAALTPANEPGQQTDYPGMDLSDTAEADLLAKELFPRLASARLGGLKVLGFDYNWATPFPSTLLGDKRIAGKIDGIAYHCYGGSPTAMHVAHDAGKEAWVTECTSGSHPMRHGTALEQLIRSTRNWARAFLTWNVALGKFADGSDGFPHTGHGCTDCIGAVRIENGKATYTRDFSDLGHASKFVHPGATRIGSNTFADYRDETNPSAKGGLEDVAFENPDGTIAVVTFNSSDAPITFQIRFRGQSVTYTLPARSPATFVWKS